VIEASEEAVFCPPHAEKAEMTLPGREVAYIVKARERFDTQQRTAVFAAVRATFLGSTRYREGTGDDRSISI